jgi:type IV secretory pathway TraG/TraD family ATPase VirD4
VVRAKDWLAVWLRDDRHCLALGLSVLVALSLLFDWLIKKRLAVVAQRKRENAIIEMAEGSVYCGVDESGESVHIKTKQRGMHTQVIGTTNAGKTESVILPWAIQDIQQNRGLILIDGKSDRALLDKLWAYVVASRRESDFHLFSLSHLEESCQFNPLLGGTPEEVSERVFNSFEFENPYYRSIQFEIFSQMMRVFAALKITPTFLRLYQAISTPRSLKHRLGEIDNLHLTSWLGNFIELPPSDRSEKTSGLTAALSQFAFGATSALFNTESPNLTLEKALSENKIIYFQLPVLLVPFLGKATGKLVLQCLQSAVANRHRSEKKSTRFYSVFLDDFTEYLYPGFVSVLNKSRSANVGVVFAHQALGDIKTLGDAIANSILTNANVKVFMRGNDPDSAEYFSKVIGTVKTMKYTERTKKGFFSRAEETGDASAREVDEFIVHPNEFKSKLGAGEAVMVIPHEAGSKTVRLKFQMFPDLAATREMIHPVKKLAEGLPPPPGPEPENPTDKTIRRTEHQDPFSKEAA